MPSHDGPNETKPEAVSRGAATPFEADKPVEYSPSIRFWNTLAPIGHLENGPVGAAQDPDLNFAAAGIFKGVVE
jgi:hypothetical protein